MEWTAGDVLLAAFFQRHTGIHHIDYVDTGQEFVDKALWDAAGHAVYFIGSQYQGTGLCPPVPDLK